MVTVTVPSAALAYAGPPLHLTAPAVMPAAAAAPMAMLREQARRGLGTPVYDDLTAIEVAAYGRRRAALLRRRAGREARLVAFYQLVRLWGETC